MINSHWKDILHLRMTCKWLLEVTKSRAIWAYLVEEHISTNPYPPRLERPIDMYMSTELERLSLRWKGVDSLFAGHHPRPPKPVRKRTFRPEKSHCWTHLVEGSRWFLSIDYAGAVTYYDLDAEIPTEMPLIPSQIRYGDNYMQLAVDYGVQSPILKITLALFLADKVIHRNFTSWFHVWSISLLLDSSNHGIGLVSQHLATFPLHFTIGYVESLSVLGESLAFNAYHLELCQTLVFVVCWKDANGQSDIYPWCMLQNCNTLDEVHLVTGGRILVLGSATIKLYGYTTTGVTTDVMTPVLPLSLWSYKFDRSVSKLRSRRFHSLTTTSFVVMVSGHTFHVLDIPNNPIHHGVPSIAKFKFDHSAGRMLDISILGSSRAIVFNENYEAEIVQYHSNVSHRSKFYSLDNSLTYYECNMDEYTGRVVIPTAKLGRGCVQVVIDLDY